MDNLPELLQLYDLTSLPKALRKERELKRWRDIMAQQRYEQQEFEEITAPVDDREAKKRHLESIRNRWFGYYRKCKDQQKKLKLIDQYNYLARQR